jgi:uncharacterized membrane protein YbhN (UPF0104 family)
VQKSWLRWAFPVLFTAAGALAVVRSLGSFAVFRSFSINWLDLSVMAVLYLLFTAGRGLRFRLLIRSAEPWLRTAEVGFVYTAACNVFPGGIGEFTLPAMYRRLPEGTARATAALAFTRVLDLLSWLPFLAVGFFLARLPSGAFILLPLSLAGTVVATLVVFARPVRRPVLRLLARLPHPAVAGFLEAFERRLDEMAGNTGAFLVTLALRLLSIGAYYFVLLALGIHVGIGAAAVGGALVAMLLALPIQGVAGFGTVELWWMSVLHLYGVALPLAAVAAIGLHLSMLIVSLLLGAASFLETRSLTLERLVSP